MKTKRFLLLLSVSLCFCISSLAVFAADLKIETGKTEDIDFRGYNSGNSFNYDDQQIYDNLNIGAGTKVVLDSQWQYVFLSSDSGEIASVTTSTYTYQKDEILATIAISNTGNLILNSGSELSLRNEYSLVSSTQNAALEYEISGKDASGQDIITLKDAFFSNDNNDGYVYNGITNGSITGPADNLFTGLITFAEGDSDTVLTFQPVSSKEVVYGTGMLPEPIDPTETQVDVIVEEESPGAPTLDIASFSNDFQIDSNRAVFNVLGGAESVNRIVTLTGGLYGDGTIVKKGGATLLLNGDASGLTGSNTGYSWNIEEGKLTALQQSNLGLGNIYIAQAGTLGLLNDGIFDNNITSDGGSVSIEASQIELSGDINGEFIEFSFLGSSELYLTGSNTVDDFLISFEGKNNFLYVNDLSLAGESVTAHKMSLPEENANFQLVIDQNFDGEYAGSLNGQMYVQKTGTGTLTLSGNNTYTEGTYISEGGILMSNSNSLGTGKILFDSGVRGDSTTYASLGVSSITTTGVINLLNNIHIDEGAVINVYDNQELSLSGDLESYDTRPDYYAQLVKTGLGVLEIAESTSSARKVNISTFTIEEGGFRLDNNVVLGSDFSLNGSSSYLEMAEGSGITNKIDINSGDLIIYNESNISSASVNFNNTSTGTLSKLQIQSDCVLSSSTLSNPINIAKGIEFVIDSTTTAFVDAFNFAAAPDSIINKSGEGNFIFNTNNTDFVLSELGINSGYFTLVNGSSMTVSSSAAVNGGILSFEQGSYFQSSASGADEKIIVSSGGIKIYDDNNIETSTLLSFEGTDSSDLAKLIVVADNVNLTNSIFVKTGVIVENENNLTISGDSITYDSASSGIFAKSGAGTMTIAQTSGGAGFDMGEIDVLQGLMSVTTDVNVSTVSVLGDTSAMALSNSTMTATNNFVLSGYDYFDVLSAELNVGENLYLENGDFNVNMSSVSVADTIDMSNIDIFTLNNSTMTAVSFTASDINDVDISSSVIAVSSSMALTNFTDLNFFSAELSAVNNLTFSSGTALFTNSNILNTANLQFTDTNLLITTSSFDVSGGTYFTDSSIIISSSNLTSQNMYVDNSNIILRNDSVLAADTYLESGSELKGFGTVDGLLTVKSNAALSVGENSNEYGQITADSIKFETDSFLYIDVKSSNSVTSGDKLEVLQNVTVEDGVTLGVNVIGDNSEFTSKKTFEIITCGGILNSSVPSIFDSIELSNARLKADVKYLGNSILLNIFQSWSSYALLDPTNNEKAMLDTLNNIFENPAESLIFDKTLAKLDELYGDYQNTGNSAPFLDAISDLSGVFYANSFMSSSLLSKTNMIYNRLSDSSEREKNNIWAQAYTNTQNINKNESNPEFENNVYGLIAGFDSVAAEDFVAGISGYYGTGEFKQSEDKADITDAGVNVYAVYQYDNIDFKGLIGCGVQNYQATRKITFINDEIKSKYDVTVLNFDVEAAYNHPLSKNIALKPLIGFNCAVASNGDFTEDGNLEQKLQIESGSYTKAEVRAGIGLASNNISKFSWHISAVARQIVDGNKFVMTANFASVPDEKFEIESTKISNTVFTGNIGGLYCLTDSINVFADVSADTASGTNMFGGNLGVSYRW